MLLENHSTWNSLVKLACFQVSIIAKRVDFRKSLHVEQLSKKDIILINGFAKNIENKINYHQKYV